MLISTSHTNPAVSGDTFIQYHNSTTNSDLFIADTIPTSFSTGGTLDIPTQDYLLMA